MQLLIDRSVYTNVNVSVAWALVMRCLSATSFVLVALFSAVSPAFADTHNVRSALESGNSSVGQAGNSGGAGQKYWTARSEYFETTSGVAIAGGEMPRKVLICGWHPVEGFEAEIAKEAANRADHSGH